MASLAKALKQFAFGQYSFGQRISRNLVTDRGQIKERCVSCTTAGHLIGQKLFFNDAQPLRLQIRF